MGGQFTSRCFALPSPALGRTAQGSSRCQFTPQEKPTQIKVKSKTVRVRFAHALTTAKSKAQFTTKAASRTLVRRAPKFQSMDVLKADRPTKMIRLEPIKSKIKNRSAQHPPPLPNPTPPPAASTPSLVPRCCLAVQQGVSKSG